MLWKNKKGQVEVKHKKSIMFIMPFGVRNNINFDKLYYKLEADLEKTYPNFSIYRADSLKSSNIDIKMYKAISSADIVVADLTFYNPNVMYELGIRHALFDRTTKLICNKIMKDKYYSKEMKLPFDINHININYYDTINRDSLIEYIVQEEVEIDSAIRSSLVKLPRIKCCVLNDFKNVFYDKKQKFLRNEKEKKLRFKGDIFSQEWEETYKKINRIISEQETEKNFHYSEKFKELKKYERFFGPYFEPYALILALCSYKREETNAKYLFEAKKIIEALNPDSDSSSEVLGLLTSISNRLLKIGQITNSEADSISSLFFYSKKTYYAFGAYLMSRVYLGRNGYLSDDEIMAKNEVRCIAKRLSKQLECIYKAEVKDAPYIEETKNLIDSVNKKISAKTVWSKTTKSNIREINLWLWK